MGPRIGKVIVAAVAAEALAIATLVVLVAVFGPRSAAAAQAYAERLGAWVGPIAGAVFCLLGGWWAARKLAAGQVLQGALVGFATALIDVAILIASGAPFQMLFVVSNLGRLLAGAAGGWLASPSRSGGIST
jgi:hypothetical protein